MLTYEEIIAMEEGLDEEEVADGDDDDLDTDDEEDDM